MKISLEYLLIQTVLATSYIASVVATKCEPYNPISPVIPTKPKRPTHPTTSISTANSYSQSSTSIDPYIKCLEDNGNSVIWGDDFVFCSCLLNGSVSCTGEEPNSTNSSSDSTDTNGASDPTPVDPYQQCLDDHGGLATWVADSMNCSCLPNGSVSCNGENPDSPYQKCINDHGGKATFIHDDQICSCLMDGNTTC
ncbi:hypothetical protein BB558_006506 [Smittium angustum]|uniref:Uncharacterized protein n=1 Tax=Smittium angustum TaxID=133377 RepID=A0A2U1IXK3_SMIAN|nr:hypothetical protein BB558_006506 [Smittium angustum]